MRVLPTNWMSREEWIRWTLHINIHRGLFSSCLLGCSFLRTVSNSRHTEKSAELSDTETWRKRKLEMCKYIIVQQLCRWFYYLKTSWFLCPLSLSFLCHCLSHTYSPRWAHILIPGGELLKVISSPNWEKSKTRIHEMNGHVLIFKMNNLGQQFKCIWRFYQNNTADPWTTQVWAVLVHLWVDLFKKNKYMVQCYGSSVGKESACSMGDPGLIPVSKILGEGNSNPFQYSCLENPWYREAWWATVDGVHKKSDMT